MILDQFFYCINSDGLRLQINLCWYTDSYSCKKVRANKTNRSIIIFDIFFSQNSTHKVKQPPARSPQNLNIQPEKVEH